MNLKKNPPQFNSVVTKTAIAPEDIIKKEYESGISLVFVTIHLQHRTIDLYSYDQTSIDRLSFTGDIGQSEIN